MAARPSERSGPNRPCGLTTPAGLTASLGDDPIRRALHEPSCDPSTIYSAFRSAGSAGGRQSANFHAGDQSVGATPVPIPNTAVKPYSADGTPPERARESRPSPAPLAPPHDAPGSLRSGGVVVCGHADAVLPRPSACDASGEVAPRNAPPRNQMGGDPRAAWQPVARPRPTIRRSVARGRGHAARARHVLPYPP